MSTPTLSDAELLRLAEAAIKEAPGEWSRDFQKSEGEYGSGPDTHTGFNVPVLYAGEKQLLTADASDIALISEDWDEHGVIAWDEASTRVVDYLAAANPSRIKSLLSEKAELEREVERLREALTICADDLEAEILARASGELPRRIERDLETVRIARQALSPNNPAGQAMED